MEPGKKIAVSASAAAQIGTCETAWRFAHHDGWNLEPKKLGIALTRGLVGHLALETWYRAVAFDGKDPKEVATKIQLQVLEKSFDLAEDPKFAEMYSGLSGVLGEYFRFYESDFDDYEIIGVEELVEADLIDNPHAFFVGRADLFVRYRKGPHRGEISPLDHKFVYNFWSPIHLRINAQLPGYIMGARKKFPGELIKRAIVNQIRHRSDARERFSRPEIVPVPNVYVEVMNNHSKQAARIAYLKTLSREDARDETTRSISKFNCEYCLYATLCEQELFGADTTEAEKVHYTRNSYRYEDKTD